MSTRDVTPNPPSHTRGNTDRWLCACTPSDELTVTAVDVSGGCVVCDVLLAGSRAGIAADDSR